MPICVIIATIGVAMIGLGTKGFTKRGIALSRFRRITGRNGRVVGWIVIGFGSLLALAGFGGMILIASTYDY